jgi:hypothetical protein
MKHRSIMAVLFIVCVLAACRKKEEQTEVVPPGFCRTEAECQPVADRQNAYQDELRQKLAAQGVHEQYLPCGKYQAAKAPNGYWCVTRETSRCPATTNQQDPHPDPSNTKQSNH